MPNTEYCVKWITQISAESPEDAAQKCAGILLDQSQRGYLCFEVGPAFDYMFVDVIREGAENGKEVLPNIGADC